MSCLSKDGYDHVNPSGCNLTSAVPPLKQTHGHKLIPCPPYHHPEHCRDSWHLLDVSPWWHSSTAPGSGMPATLLIVKAINVLDSRTALRTKKRTSRLFTPSSTYNGRTVNFLAPLRWVHPSPAPSWDPQPAASALTRFLLLLPSPFCLFTDLPCLTLPTQSSGNLTSCCCQYAKKDEADSSEGSFLAASLGDNRRFCQGFWQGTSSKGLWQ